MSLLKSVFLLTIVGALFFEKSEAKFEKKVFHSGDVQVQLLELYSSEGCSSCPPADRYLASLSQVESRKKFLWKKVVPVGFHVDYWNRLGWVDRFSQAEFTKRQRDYARLWRQRPDYRMGEKISGTSSGVYTPGFIMSGREWAIEKGLKSKGQKVGNLTVEMISSYKMRVQFSPTQNLPQKTFKIFGALLGNGLTSIVKTGENSGKTLQHNFVVLDFKNSNIKQIKSGDFQGEIQFSFPKKVEASSYSFAVWVSEQNGLVPIQSVGGDL